MNRVDGRLRGLRFRYQRRRVVDPFGDFWRRCRPAWRGFSASAGWPPAWRLAILVLLLAAIGIAFRSLTLPAQK
jgi:hypothetical protein